MQTGRFCAALTTEKAGMYRRDPCPDHDKWLYKSLSHDSITLSCDSMAVLEYGDEKDAKTESIAAGETVTIKPGDSELASGRLTFKSANDGRMITVHSLRTCPGNSGLSGTYGDHGGARRTVALKRGGSRGILKTGNAERDAADL
ncbi:MAG: hypothetical protein ACLUAR_16975 [Pilosibacter sp.]